MVPRVLQGSEGTLDPLVLPVSLDFLVHLDHLETEENQAIPEKLEDLDLRVVVEKLDNLVHKVEKAAKVSQVPGEWQEA